MSNKYESKLCLEFLYKITEKRKALCLNLKELNNIFENLMDEETYNKYLKTSWEKQAGYVKNFLIKELEESEGPKPEDKGIPKIFTICSSKI